MNPPAFINTNHRQHLGALVSAHSLRRHSRHADRFDVRIIEHKDYPFFARHEGESFLRDGVTREWHNEDLQSFTPLRFMPPELMGYQGRALVIDPDIFAVGDGWASSVMLLDCAKLTHWRTEKQFDELFTRQRDYRKWVNLEYEPVESIGMLEPEWNDFDRLTPRTKMVHNTRRKTQPWKTGLPVDFLPAERFKLFPPVAWLLRARRRLLGEYALLGHHSRHPH